VTKDKDLNVFEQIIDLEPPARPKTRRTTRYSKANSMAEALLPNLRKGDVTRVGPEIRLHVSVPFTLRCRDTIAFVAEIASSR
jgi:hypothetical protein